MAFYLLVDFLELIDFNMNLNSHKFLDLKEFIFFLKKEAEYSLLAEICCLIGLDDQNAIVYQQMKNRSKNPESYFMIDPYDYLGFINKYSCLCIFHSHLIENEKPSDFDVKTSENCCYPFLIYSVVTEKFHIYEPEYKDYDVNIINRLKELI
jgi:proteasome lid subunit RPN8/RPN11